MANQNGQSSASAMSNDINIKIMTTLDSKNHTLHVDKSVLVSTLKQKIATVTGVQPENQRLICMGRVLNDDRLLSHYNIQDGTTLHLVNRVHITSPSETTNNQSGTSNPPSAAGTQGATRDLDVNGGNQVASNSLTIDDNQLDNPSRASQVTASAPHQNHPGPQPQAIPDTSTNNASQPNNPSQATQTPASVASQSQLPPPVIPDSLTTLSWYLNRVAHEFRLSIAGHISLPGPGIPPTYYNSVPAFRLGIPTAEYLAEVLQSTRRLLINEAAESMRIVANNLQEQQHVTDIVTRFYIESYARNMGAIFQNLGIMLTELGRTTFQLGMGASPENALVNAGPAFFVNEYAPYDHLIQRPPTDNQVTVPPQPSVAPMNNVSSNNRGNERLRARISIHASWPHANQTPQQQTATTDTSAQNVTAAAAPTISTPETAPTAHISTSETAPAPSDGPSRAGDENQQGSNVRVGSRQTDLPPPDSKRPRRE